MKVDLKLGVIIGLVGLVSLLVGVLLGKSSTPTPVASIASYGSDADGKLAKEFKEKVLLKTIRDNAKDLQVCYFDLLADKPKIMEGLLEYILKVEEDGKISEAKLIKNEFDDDEIGLCVTKKLLSYHLAPPPYGINRYIAHTIAFKSEETAKKEAEERAKNNQPPKVMPVNP